MNPRFYISALIALLLLPAVRSALASEVLYEDDFTTLDPSWGALGENLSVKDGKLTLKPSLNTTRSVLNQANVFDDAEITVEVTLSVGDTGVPGGLIFWAKDYGSFYCLCINASGYFKISRYVIDRWIDPVSWTANEAINQGVGQINKLRVTTKGRQATAYINDKQVVTFNGQPPRGGSCIGISGTSAEASACIWQFAKLKVTGAAPPAAAPPAAAPPAAAPRAAAPLAVASPPLPPAPPRPDKPVALRLQHHRKRPRARTVRGFFEI